MARQAVGEAADDLFDNGAFELAGGEIIEKEEGHSALYGDVVDAVVHQVGADGVVDAELEGDLELGADAVCAGDQDGVGVLCNVESEEAAEAADVAEDLLVECLLREIFDALLGAIPGGDVHASIGIAHRLSCGGWFCGSALYGQESLLAACS